VAYADPTTLWGGQTTFAQVRLRRLEGLISDELDGLARSMRRCWIFLRALPGQGFALEDEDPKPSALTGVAAHGHESRVAKALAPGRNFHARVPRGHRALARKEFTDGRGSLDIDAQPFAGTRI